MSDNKSLKWTQNPKFYFLVLIFALLLTTGLVLLAMNWSAAFYLSILTQGHRGDLAKIMYIPIEENNLAAVSSYATIGAFVGLVSSILIAIVGAKKSSNNHKISWPG